MNDAMSGAMNSAMSGAMSGSVFWAMIFAMGAYQGLNPSAGWLPALGRGMESRSRWSVVERAGQLAWGHFLGMALVVALAAAALAVFKPNPMALRLPLGAALIGFGLFKLWKPRHPRFLSRIPPTRPVKWSFLMSFTHCASPLMMLFSLTSFIMLDHVRLFQLSGTHRIIAYVAAAFLICAVMAALQMLVSLAIALFLYKWYELRAVYKFHFNTEPGWSAFFILMGLMAFAMP